MRTFIEHTVTFILGAIAAVLFLMWLAEDYRETTVPKKQAIEYQNITPEKRLGIQRNALNILTEHYYTVSELYDAPASPYQTTGGQSRRQTY